MSDLLIRPLAAAETDLFLTYPDPLPADVLPRTLTYPDLLARGECRPQWTWVALRGDEVAARAAWWADPGGSHPDSLHWFDPGTGPDRIEVGAALLTAAHRTLRTADGSLPESHLCLPPAWRELPAARTASEDRIAAAGKAGLRLFVERLNYRWTRDCPLPARSTRLEFHPAGDAEVLDVLRRVLVGTLDAHSRRDVERHGLDRAAERQLAELHWFPAPRDWWRLGHDQAGTLVGITVPTRNHASPVIGYLGVVPEQRGHRYATDLLAEATHRLASEPEGHI